jgi:TRAP-type C4-dicarboxylate transport system permease small subunit
MWEMEVQPNKAVKQPTPPNALAIVIKFLSRVVSPLSGVLGAVIASTAIAAMMFLTFFDVAGRFVLNKPISGSLEVTEYLMGLLVSFGLGYCALKKGHIRVDLIMQYTSRKVNLWFDLFAYGISFLMYIFITWQIWQYGVSKYTSKMTSSVLLIPVYPFAFIMAIGAAFLVLVFLRDFLQSIEEVSK